MKKRILLIEDHSETIDIYKDLFKKEGFDLEILDSGKKAVKKIEEMEKGEEKPTLILLDLMLPDVNGEDILKELRNKPKTKDIPVIIFTNYTDPQQKEKLKEMEIEKFITKTEQSPIEFLEIIKKWFKEQKK